jgi:hypothetical protein
LIKARLIIKAAIKLGKLPVNMSKNGRWPKFGLNISLLNEIDPNSIANNIIFMIRIFFFDFFITIEMKF